MNLKYRVRFTFTGKTNCTHSRKKLKPFFAFSYTFSIFSRILNVYPVANFGFWAKMCPKNFGRPKKKHESRGPADYAHKIFLNLELTYFTVATKLGIYAARQSLFTMNTERKRLRFEVAQKGKAGPWAGSGFSIFLGRHTNKPILPGVPDYPVFAL